MNRLRVLFVAALMSACTGLPTHPDRANEALAPPAIQNDRDDDSYGGHPLSTMLRGSEVVPTPGDPDGLGHASMSFNPGRAKVCYVLQTYDTGPATAARLHKGSAGETGPRVLDLTAPASGWSSGCTYADVTLVRDVLHNPETYYVNVQNAEFPDGALRGQLSK